MYYIYYTYITENQEKHKMGMKSILLVVVILILVYALWKMITTNYTTLGTMQNAMNETNVPSASLPRGIPSSCSFSTWFYVKDWTCQTGSAQGTKPKNILSLKNGKSEKVLSMNLGNCVNELNVAVLCSTTNNPGGQVSTCTIPDFPLQKWVNVIASINGRALDVYVDGKLLKTCVLAGVPKLSETSQIVIGGGFEGFVTNIKYNSDVMSPQEAWDIYSNGFGGSPFGDFLNKYKVKLSFMVDNIEQSSVST